MAKPPLLLNHFLQAWHWEAPICSLMAFLLSLKHLCLFLSLALQNFLKHTLHTTSLAATGVSLPFSGPLPLSAVFQPSLHLVAASNQSLSSTSFFKSLLITSLHLLKDVVGATFQTKQLSAFYDLPYMQGVPTTPTLAS